jgi:acetoin utilization deacetylase AcuC-like enzyme
MNIITDERCTQYSHPGHPERPARISRTAAYLRRQKALPITWGEPLPVDEKTLLRAHAPSLLHRLTDEHVDFDMDTPTYPDIAGHAKRSVGGALQAMRSALNGERAFCLLRPPGHHATRDRAMGFCYLNSIAIATLAARAEGIGRVAVFDFDVHHGNGTEDILLGQDGCAFFSIHQWPAYPGTGREHRGNCYNYPVEPRLAREKYREVAKTALQQLREFRPDLIAVSAGFDTYVGDPLAQQQLEIEDYHWLGRMIRETETPFFSLLEGGYSEDLPKLVSSYLLGIEGIAYSHQPDAMSDIDTASDGNPTQVDREVEPFWGPSF